MRAARMRAAMSRMRIQCAVGFHGRVAPDAVYARFEGCSMSNESARCDDMCDVRTNGARIVAIRRVDARTTGRARRDRDDKYAFVVGYNANKTRRRFRRRASTRARDDDGGATSARERRDERAGRDGRRGGAYMPAALRSSSIFFAAAARRAWISFSSAAFFARSSSGESVFSAEPS